MSAVRPIGDDDLGAYVDGRLSPDRREAVESFLAERPDLAASLETDRALTGLLRDRLAGKAAEPIPPRLRIASIRAARGQAARRRAVWAAAACLWLALGGALGWAARDLLHRSDSAEWMVTGRDALAAHRTYTVETVHPVEVGADQERHLTQWLSRRLGRPLVIPDLRSIGLGLVGGRLLPAETGIAALLMYADAGGSRVTVYVRSGHAGDLPTAEAGFRAVDEGGLCALVWSEGGAAYAVSASLGTERLRQIARAIADATEGRPRSREPQPDRI